MRSMSDGGQTRGEEFTHRDGFEIAGRQAQHHAAHAVERFEPESDQRLLARYLKWLALMREAAGAA